MASIGLIWGVLSTRSALCDAGACQGMPPSTSKALARRFDARDLTGRRAAAWRFSRALVSAFLTRSLGFLGAAEALLGAPASPGVSSAPAEASAASCVDIGARHREAPTRSLHPWSTPASAVDSAVIPSVCLQLYELFTCPRRVRVTAQCAPSSAVVDQEVSARLPKTRF